MGKFAVVIKVLKAFGKLLAKLWAFAKVTGKVGADVFRSVYGGIKTLKPVFQKFTLFLDKHPQLMKWMATIGTYKTVEDVITYIKKEYGDDDAREAQEIFDEMGTMSEGEFDTDLATLDSQAEDLIAGNGGTAPMYANHPEFWFSPDKKVSGVLRTDTYGDLSSLFSNVCVRTLYTDIMAISRASSLTGETTLAEMLIPDQTRDLIYQTYVNYYRRLFVEPVLDRDTLERKIAEILLSSYQAIGLAFGLKKLQDAKFSQIYKNYNAARGIHGIPSDSYLGNQGEWALIRQLTGYTTSWTEGAKQELNLRVPEYSPYDVTAIKSMNLRISNKDWTTMLSKLKQLALSDNAYKLAKYLYEAPFIDDKGEDMCEIYNFYMPTGPLAGKTIESESSAMSSERNMYQAIQDLCSDVTRLMADDKAIPALLCLIGVLDYSPAVRDDQQIYGAPVWSKNIDEDLRRNQASNTLFLKPADAALYECLNNSIYRFNVINQTAEATFDMLASNTGKPNFINDTVVYMYDRKGPVEASESAPIFPEPSILSAGEVASRIKFSWMFNLRLGGSMFWDYTIGNWIVRSNTNIYPYAEFNNRILNVTLDNAKIAQLMAGAQFSPIPGEIYIENMDLTDTVQGAENRIYKYAGASSYALYDVPDIDTVRQYMWFNLLCGIDQFEDLDKRLSVLDLQWAIS